MCRLHEGGVSRRLQGRSNTASGSDGIFYSDLLKADRTAQVLTALFNAVLRTEYFPSAWKESTTILLHKKGGRGLSPAEQLEANLADKVVREEPAVQQVEEGLPPVRRVLRA